MSAIDIFRVDAKKLADDAIKKFKAKGLKKETIGEMMAYVQILSDEVAALKKELDELPIAVLLNKPHLQEEQRIIVKAEVSRFTRGIK
jgi:hypothetical protein